MAKPKDRRRREVVAPTPFEQARDEMFQHIMRCGVIGAVKGERCRLIDRNSARAGGWVRIVPIVKRPRVKSEVPFELLFGHCFVW
jgi:hypothetical protein